LKLDTANLYIGKDASTWVYNGSTYVTKTVPATSNFYISNTTTDAGNSKTVDIKRTGSINTESSIGSDVGYFVNRNGSNTAQIGGYFNFSNAVGSNSMMFQLNASNGLDLWNYASGAWNKRFTFSNSGALTANSFVKSGGTSTEFLMADGSTTSSTLSILPVVETGTSFTLDNTYNGKVVILTASCTVTIPNGLVAGFECSFVTLAGVTQTLSLGGSVVLFNNVGTTMAEKMSFTLKNRTATNNYITVGNL